jgi:hypothetical protein
MMPSSLSTIWGLVAELDRFAEASLHDRVGVAFVQADDATGCVGLVAGQPGAGLGHQRGCDLDGGGPLGYRPAQPCPAAAGGPAQRAAGVAAHCGATASTAAASAGYRAPETWYGCGVLTNTSSGSQAWQSWHDHAQPAKPLPATNPAHSSTHTRQHVPPLEAPQIHFCFRAGVGRSQRTGRSWQFRHLAFRTRRLVCRPAAPGVGQSAPDLAYQAHRPALGAH